jgi:lysophospholipase L1-like esterase
MLSKVQRLPETIGRVGQHGTGPAARHVVVIGDSVAAGVGVAHGEDTVAGCLARALADPAATWAIHARGGLDARGVQGLLGGPAVRDDLADADAVVVSVGVNDLKAAHGLGRWRTDLDELLGTLVRSAPSAVVVLLGMPPVGIFPVLPRRLRGLLGARAGRMDAVGIEVARRHGVRHLPLGADLLEVADAFAADGLHPSAHAHARLAELVVELLDENAEGDADAVR